MRLSSASGGRTASAIHGLAFVAYQFMRQPMTKTWRTLSQRERLRGTLWAASKSRRFRDFAAERDAALLAEAEAFWDRIIPEHRAAIASLPISGGRSGACGGGGAHGALLYFLVRLLRPKRVLETGVSAGVSSRAILEAMAVNGSGQLYSSDLATHLRPEQVGIMVPERLRGRWRLYREGDEHNIPRILRDTGGEIDFIHYDSAKSYAARMRFVESIGPLADRAVVAFDDVDRNLAFRDFVAGGRHRHAVVGWVGIANLPGERGPRPA